MIHFYLLYLQIPFILVVPGSFFRNLKKFFDLRTSKALQHLLITIVFRDICWSSCFLFFMITSL